jgi:maleylpyruvate isomerase
VPPELTVEVAGARYGDGPEIVVVGGPDPALLAWLTGRPQLAGGSLTSSTGTIPELPSWG